MVRGSTRRSYGNICDTKRVDRDDCNDFFEMTSRTISNCCNLNLCFITRKSPAAGTKISQTFSLWGAISLNIQGTTHYHHHPHRKSYLEIEVGGATGKFFPRGHRIDAFDLWNISEEYRTVSVLLTVRGKREATYLVCRGEGQGGVWLLNGMALTCVAGICCLTNTQGAVCQRDLW